LVNAHAQWSTASLTVRKLWRHIATDDKDLHLFLVTLSTEERKYLKRFSFCWKEVTMSECCIALVNFIYILRAAFAPIFFCQKNFKAKLQVEKSC
jgi:hypothetical protein